MGLDIVAGIDFSSIANIIVGLDVFAQEYMMTIMPLPVHLILGYEYIILQIDVNMIKKQLQA